MTYFDSRLSLQLQLQSHLDTCYAMLRAATLKYGDRKALAQRLNVSPIYLSYLIHGQRPLTQSTSRKLAEAISWDQDQREQFLEHAILGYDLDQLKGRDLKSWISTQNLEESLTNLRSLFVKATSGSNDPQQVKTWYQEIRDTGLTLLQSASPRFSALGVVELCTMLSNVQCVLDRADEALRYARFARQIIDSLEIGDYKSNIDHFRSLWATVIQVEATALHNLRLEREAHEKCTVEAKYILAAMDAQVDASASTLGILTLCEIPRFSILHAEILAKGTLDSLDSLSNEKAAEQHSFNITRALGLSYLRHGVALRKVSPVAGHRYFAKAEKEFLSIYGRHSTASVVSQATFLRDFAHQQWSVGDFIGWEKILREAFTVMINARLAHQIRLTRSLFGESGGRIYDEVKK